MEKIIALAIFLGTLAVLTDGQYSHRNYEELDSPVPVYPRSHASLQGYDNYVDAVSSYDNPEYQVRAKPVQLYVTYTRQGRGKKKGYGGWGKGGWWYFRDHKGCHSGTFGAPPGPGLEHEHYISGACGKLGNHFKRNQGHRYGGHGQGHGSGYQQQGWRQRPHHGGYGGHGYGSHGFGQGKPYGGGLGGHGGYGRGGGGYRSSGSGNGYY